MTQFLLSLVATFSISTYAAVNGPSPVQVPAKLRAQLKSFEPSAGIYVQQMGKFLISSDDTTKKDAPWLFTMSESGEIEKTPVTIKGIKKITDVESLSQVGGSIFVMSSQGLNKNGKDKLERNLFLQAKFDTDTSLTIEKSVSLRPILIDALMTANDPVLVQMRGQIERQLDIESHFIKDGELYVGLKEPQPSPSHAVIVKLGNVADVFAGRVRLGVWRVLDLRTGGGAKNYLSDLAWRGGDLYATSTSGEAIGHLWLLDEPIKRVSDFQDAHPEGVMFKPDGTMTLLFDQGSDGDGQWLTL